mmetsp:Transcript_36598/g.67069  ORF Transcript_36598/g.67069 Transcript_36598/m.67069 type:complete len:393 (-) Transcript_36598:39-1217(-)
MASSLDLPEKEFSYQAGSTGRPWAHFTGRWEAIKPRLAKALSSAPVNVPRRVVDVGSCTGYFSLQVANAHPEADVIGVEGSVGIGNGTVGMAGSVRDILQTRAVQTHLRWLKRLRLENCLISPEVWDYERIEKMSASGRPICDVLLLLSIVHHIEGVAAEQLAAAGYSKTEGFIVLMSKLLLLAPTHFIEMPYRPWLESVYEKYGTQRAILGAAAEATGLEWKFTGPIYQADWFGPREVWMLEVGPGGMKPVDLEVNPFHHLYQGGLQDSSGPGKQGALDGDGPLSGTAAALIKKLEASGFSVNDMGTSGDLQRMGIDIQESTGYLLDPYYTAATADAIAQVDDKIAAGLTLAPTQLLTAHLALREAMQEAEGILTEVRESGLLGENPPRRR